MVTGIKIEWKGDFTGYGGEVMVNGQIVGACSGQSLDGCFKVLVNMAEQYEQPLKKIERDTLS